MFTGLMAVFAAAAVRPDAAYESITGDDLAKLIETLADDRFEGREAGTTGGRATEAFLAEAFAERGIEPGNAGSYFQPVALAKINRAGKGSLEINNGKQTTRLREFSEFVSFATSGSAPVNSISGKKLVFVGYGITAPEYGWDDYADVDVRDAIVVVLRGEPSRDGDKDFFLGRELTDHYQLAKKSERAAENGAAGIIFVHTDASAGWPWSLLESGGSTGSQMFLDESGQSSKVQASAQISEPAVRKLFAAMGADFDRLRDQAVRAPASIALGGTASLSFKGSREAVITNNVVARIAGREAADECIIYTAHWDHIGVNPKASGDKVNNGAVDNATGTAALLEIAQAFAAMDRAPRRSVYFIATTAEEKGLLGAEYYVKNPICPLAKTVAVLNMDAHFPFGSQKGMIVPGLGFTDLESTLSKASLRVGRKVISDSSPEVGGFFRNDSYAFVKAGVPSIYAVGGPLEEELTEGSAILAKYTDYVTTKYHKPGDEFNRATWDMTGLVEDFRIMFDTGRMLAEDNRYPNFRYDLPWRATRDAMMRVK